MRTAVIVLCFLVFSGSWRHTNAQLKATTFEAVELLMQTQQKPVVIFIHTSWCTYCKAMEATTFKNKEVVEKLNNSFYFIRLDAEEKRDIRFLGRVFKYRPSGPRTGTHELAQQLGSMDGKMSYPVLCVLNTDYEITFQYNAYLKAGELLEALEAVLRE